MLSNKQKSYLSQLARRAQYRLAAMARGRGEVMGAVLDFTKEGMDAWRQKEVGKACGKLGLRCCSQEDYKAVEAHFLHLIGEDGRAMQALVRSATEPVRQAQAVLVRELARFGLRQGYAEAICRRQFRCQVQDLTDESKVWNLVYTIRNRGKAKRDLTAKNAKSTEMRQRKTVEA